MIPLGASKHTLQGSQTDFVVPQENTSHLLGKPLVVDCDGLLRKLTRFQSKLDTTSPHFLRI